MSELTDLPAHVDVAIVGTGFAGLGMAIKLKQAGRDDFVVLERAGDVGGTWRDNTYPGCQCDVPSNVYSFSFAPNPQWTRTFAPQPEIWDYLRHVTDRYGLRSHLRFDAELTGAAWDDERRLWRIETVRGSLTARVLVGAMGGLSEPAIPRIPGLDSFEGRTFHSATWDHDHDLTGRRVAVIGTGASAIQFVPAIQSQVGQLTVFQRTPPWIMPRKDRPVRPRERALFRLLPAAQQLVRKTVFWGRELTVLPFMHPKRLSRIPERMARAHLARSVGDPELRAKLTPDYAVGCKRILLSNEWYPALSQPNVEVVTDAIAEIRPNGVVTADGREHAVDTIVFGTGFRVTDMPFVERLRGSGGRLLGDVWREGGMQALRGTTVAGFPNLFLLVGPNTGLGHNSIVFMIESQLAYAIEALRATEQRGAAVFEADPSAQARFNVGVQERMRGTVWTAGGCASWYLDAHGRNTTLWPGASWRFRMATRRFDAAEYAFATAAPPAPAHVPAAVA
ncbi:flavin-containing monooxygenase [Conexibacter woesei]|uniref:FAD-dependent pyridine nucleotide-disulphide oxidoreductase n=1 Tax=Conexibacter woesei (strain DSM 14684 / CCUG 47730 / CIP 108061 / JCM 11494 / NBRC 100937 / ID131577) TaxID=469383 RepID=D3FB58_CONWI|nr:NAD(P)/FAD-dependent oxidoreductase [Conexibacter woesei]ADB53250.1 FAD-dependent pyridine nucleotide-disulphide oxidoreductase [Conexibacter woesei DSM 14684]